jgi:type II restriction/modification system DNA methylase subunit YeeA
MLQNGYDYNKNPILKPLHNIENRDALIGTDGKEAEWPAADVVIGNPPFLGDRKMIRELGEDYTATLRNLYIGKVPGGADLVCYWFHIATQQILTGKLHLAGLVSTSSIRGGANRKVLDYIGEHATIFNAWSDEPWINEGAAVRVSLICFSAEGQELNNWLDGSEVEKINSDLTELSNLENSFDLTKAVKLYQNSGASFIGTQKNGAFDISGDTAREWLKLPNPNGRPNSDVVRPWANGMDITRRPSDTWVIDFDKMSEDDAALYENPFYHVVTNVKPSRVDLRRDWHRTHWWCFGDPRPALKDSVKGLGRFIVTSMVAKHRIFAWMHEKQIPENLCVVITRSDEATFGILHSRFHELWSLWLGTALEDRPRYTPSTTFETFPFPQGITPADTQNEPILDGKLLLPSVVEERKEAARNIATVANELNRLRENWLNPPEWVDWVQTPEEAAAGFPLRPVAKTGMEAELKKRTLTNLYNNRKPGSWLDIKHNALDIAVAHAYGWADYTPEMSDDEILHRLLKLNLERENTKK